MSTSIHIDNKEKYILVLGRRATQGLERKSAEKVYSINFTVTKKKFCLSLHFNGENSYLFVNGTEIIKFKAKDYAIVANPLCLGSISKDWATDNMKKTGFTGYVYDFSPDYNAVTLDDIKDIHNYFIKKNDIVYMKIFSFIKKVFVLGLTVLSSSIIGALNCVSKNNQKCVVRPKMVDINSNSPMFYPFSIKVNKCSGNDNSINDPYAKICVPDTVKDLNVRVFNLMSRNNDPRHIKWHETCKCICRLDKLFVIVNKDGTKINVDVNAKNRLIKVYVIKDMFGIQVIANVNVINLGVLVNI